MVFCRNSTLLCRQLVRRSMVFSTVQISMPGTSCARTENAGKQIARVVEAARAMRPVMEIFISTILSITVITANCAALAEDFEDTTLKPQSRVEVLCLARS